MLSIHLENLSFFAHHGLYDFERENGNNFIVNALIQYHPSGNINTIDDTIDYASIYKLIKHRMELPTPLLETIVMDIASKILQQFSMAEFVSIQLIKENPPINNFKGKVAVSFQLLRNEIN